MKIKFGLYLALGLILLLCEYSNMYADEALQQVPVAIHISSNISDGDLSLDEIVRLVRNNGYRGMALA